MSRRRGRTRRCGRFRLTRQSLRCPVSSRNCPFDSSALATLPSADISKNHTPLSLTGHDNVLASLQAGTCWHQNAPGKSAITLARPCLAKRCPNGVLTLALADMPRWINRRLGSVIFRFNSFRIIGRRPLLAISPGVVADLRCAEHQTEICVLYAPARDRSRRASGGLGSIHSDGVSWECSSVIWIDIDSLDCRRHRYRRRSSKPPSSFWLQSLNRDLRSPSGRSG
jgi:hypothetical protein